jgi:hypothetical protein
MGQNMAKVHIATKIRIRIQDSGNSERKKEKEHIYTRVLA